MKTSLCSLIILLALTGPLSAGPLRPQDIAAEAKWVAHLDVERFKETDLGRLIGTGLLDKQLAKPVADLKRELDFDLDWRRIRSVTAYGTSLKQKPDANAVLIIRSDLDIKDAVEAAVEKFALAGVEEAKRLRRLDEVNHNLYALGDKGFASLLADNTVVAGRERVTVEAAARVLRGEGVSLANTRKLADFPAGKADFLFFGVLEAPADEMRLPPQAAALKTIAGGRLGLSEESSKLAASLALKARSTESATQLQQSVQGLVAFAALSLPGDERVQELVRSARVSSSENLVTVGFQYPSERVAAAIVQRGRKAQ